MNSDDDFTGSLLFLVIAGACTIPRAIKSAKIIGEEIGSTWDGSTTFEKVTLVSLAISQFIPIQEIVFKAYAERIRNRV